MQRITSNEKPLVIQKLNDGTYYYNYDIKSEIILTKEYPEDNDYKETIQYNFIQVCLRGTPSYSRCVRAIIRQYVSEDEEFSLINDYAASQLPLSELDSHKYEEYLSLIEEIKYKVKKDFNLIEEDPIKIAIKNIQKQIINYDASDNVNQFTVSGIPVWLDKDTRAGLKLRFESELAMGKTVTTLWYKDMQFPLQLQQAIQMLYAIELYASQCYDCTQNHLANVAKLTNLSDIEQYDYTINYPNKLEF